MNFYLRPARVIEWLSLTLSASLLFARIVVRYRVLRTVQWVVTQMFWLTRN